MTSARILTVLGAGALAVACGMPLAPGGVASADGTAARCAQGFDMLEAQSCQGDLRGQNPAVLQFSLEEFKRQCKDAASAARIQKIETSCMAAQKAAVREMKDDRRKIRARYVAEVSELLLDPAYPPAVDRYRDLEEQAFHGDERAKREAQARLAELQQLAQRHGIDPRYGKELELW